mgnify:CR=1 FL=1
MAVYTPLRERRLQVLPCGHLWSRRGCEWISAVFLWLSVRADLTYLEGQMVGKLWASLAAFVAIPQIFPT